MKKHKTLRVKTLFFAGLMLISLSNASATDVVGGQITWQKVGTDSFLVTLTGYRDCNGIAFPDMTIPAKCLTTGTSFGSLSITKPSPVDITPTCGSSCTRCQSSSCSFPYGMQKYVYQKLLVLSNPGSCCDIGLSCYLGNRPSTITTGAAGSQCYVEARLNRCLSFDNNSPQMSNNPINIICVGQDFIFNLGASDLDKDSSGKLLDSISYEWAKPQTGAGTYTTWSGSYTYDKPVFFWGFPNTSLPFPRGLHLDKTTGDISFRPMKVEQTIMAVKMSEWRKINGTRTKIGETTCDFMVIIISCPNNNAPVLSGPFYKEVNVGDSLFFSITTNDYDTKDTLNIDWSKNIPGANWSSNNKQVKHPTGVLKLKADSSMSGNLYTFTATVKDDACPISGKSTRIYQIQVKPACLNKTVTIVKKYLGCNKFVFYPDSLNSTYKYDWQGITNDAFTSTGDSVVRQYSESKNIKIRLTTTYFTNCSKAYDLSFTSDSLIKVDLPSFAYLGNPDTMTVYPKVQFAHGAFKFKWSDGDTVKLNKLLSLKGNKTLVMYLTVTDTNGCTALDSIILYKNVVNVELGADKIKCKGNGVALSYNITNFGSSTYVYTEWYKYGYVTPLSFNTTYYTTDTGLFAVKVNFTTGLVAYDTIRVKDYPIPVVDAGADMTVCSDAGLIELTGSPPATSGSFWSGTAISKINNKYYFDPHYYGICNGCSYNVTYIYKDSFGCTSVNDSRNIKVVYSSIKPEIGSYPNQCIKNPPVKLKASHVPGTWTGKGVSNGYFNPATAGAGTHQIIYRVGDEPCYEYDTAFIKVIDSLPSGIKINNPYNRNEFCNGYGLVPLTGLPSGGVFSGDVVPGNYFYANRVSGTYKVKYTYTDSFGCISSKEVDYTIGNSEVHIDKSNPYACINADWFSLSATKKMASGVLWWTGLGADGNFLSPADKLNISYVPGPNDKLKKSVLFKIQTIDSICYPAFDSVVIQLVDLPKVEFTADPPVYDELSGSGKYRVRFYNLTTDNYGVKSVFWDFGNQTNKTTWDAIAYYYPGLYSVSLTVKTVCEATLTKKDFILIPSGIEEDSDMSVSVYPVPSTDEVNIKSDNEIEGIYLYNQLGKLVFRSNNINSKLFVLNKFPSGIYLLQIIDKEGKQKQAKIIFQ